MIISIRKSFRKEQYIRGPHLVNLHIVFCSRVTLIPEAVTSDMCKMDQAQNRFPLEKTVDHVKLDLRLAVCNQGTFSPQIRSRKIPKTLFLAHDPWRHLTLSICVAKRRSETFMLGRCLRYREVDNGVKLCYKTHPM